MDVLPLNSSLSVLHSMPYWSLSGHVAVAALVFPLRGLLFPALAHRTSHPYFQPVNEFLCSFLWVFWTLECMVIDHTTSSSLALSTLFVRMLIAPYIFHGACVNPAFNVYTHLRLGVKPQAILAVVHNVLIELLAMGCAVVFVSVQWNLLGMVSLQHHDFLSVQDRSYMLQVTPISGFLTELITTFIALLPIVLIRQSFLAVLVSACLTLCLIFQVEAATGAFMNPLNALAVTLTFHMDKLAVWDCLVHILVYWYGPYMGAGLAAVLANRTRTLRKPESARK